MDLFSDPQPVTHLDVGHQLRPNGFLGLGAVDQKMFSLGQLQDAFLLHPGSLEYRPWPL